MNELEELESGIERLKRESQSKKVLIDALEKEKSELLRRSDELSERLTQTNETYRESTRKIMDFVTSQGNRFKSEIAELSNSLKMLSTLEGRLEEQEKNHEKSLRKIEKELLVVEKSLSDVERMKTELSKQNAFFQESKLQMEKGIQSGMSYLRKEMDVNRREDAKKALEEFKQEIERIASIENELNSYKKNQESRVDRLTDELSSVRSSLAELKILKERSVSIEEAVQLLGSKVEKLSAKQRAASSMITSELSKHLEKSISDFKKEFEGRRSEDSSNRLREMKQELDRISSLEQSFKQNEKRMDGISKELSSVKGTAEQIGVLRDKIEENLHMNQSLADRTVNGSDFERATKSISKRMDEIEGRLFGVDKRLSTDKNRLEKAILDILNQEKVLEGTQENIKQWFDGRFRNIEKRVSTGIDALTTQMEEGSSLVEKLKEKSQKMDLITKSVPKKLEDHSSAIMRLIDSKASLASSLESLSGDIDRLSGNLSSSLERIASLEKGLSSSDKSKGSLIAGLASDLAAYKEELKGQSMLLKELSDSSRIDMTSLRSEVGSSLKSISNEIEARLKEMSKSGLKEIRDRTTGLVTANDFSSELKILKSTISEIESRNTDITGRIERELEKTKKSMEKGFAGLNEDQAIQFKKEFDYISKNIDSIRNISSDIRLFGSRIADLERFSKTRISEQDFKEFRNYITSRLSEMEDARTKSISDISKNLEKFKLSLESGKISRDEFSKSAGLIDAKIQDLGVFAKSSSNELKKDLESLKKIVLERFGESKDSQLKEFKNELNRISRLEESIDTYSRTHESRLDNLSEELSSLRAVPSEIGALKEKIKSLEDISGSAVYSREFSQKMTGINSTLEQLQKALSGLDRRVQGYEKGLDNAVERAFAEDSLIKKGQKGMNSLIDSRISDVDKRLTRGIEELSGDLSKSSFAISELRERVSEMSAIPEQTVSNTSLIDSLKDRIVSLESASKTVIDKASYIDEQIRILKSNEGKLAELGSLKEKLREIESLAGKLREDAVPESEFVETIQALSKRIDGIEKLYSGIDKKTSLHESELDSAVEKALSREKIIEASQKQMQKIIDSRITGIEEKLSDRISSEITQIKSGLEDIPSIKEDLSSLKARDEVMGSDIDSAKRMDKRVDALYSELKAMNERLMDEKTKTAELEQSLKSSIESQRQSVMDILRKERTDVENDISDEMAKIMKDGELGELKRKQDFENLLRKFQELHIKTQQNLDSISSQRENFLELERAMKERVEKHKKSVESKMLSGHEKLKTRLDDSENLIMKLNNMISELQIRLEKKKDVNMEFKSTLSDLKEEIFDRVKTNEEMFDSEMDAFRSNLGDVVKRVNQTSFIKPDSKATGSEKLAVITKSIGELDNRLNDEMNKFKKYVMDHMENMQSPKKGVSGP